jgi:hypothetical protein
MVKVTLGEQPTPSEKPFPKLMIGHGSWIIYAIDKTNVLHIAGPHAGVFANCFANIDKDFTDYNEPITIQNA